MLCITKDGDESESVMDSLGKNGRSLQELYESETVIPNGTNGQFDFALESERLDNVYAKIRLKVQQDSLPSDVSSRGVV